MSRDYIRIRSNREREKWLERAKEALGTDQDSEAIELALKHTAQSVDALEDAKDNLTPNQAETLSTEVVRLTQYPQVRTD